MNEEYVLTDNYNMELRKEFPRYVTALSSTAHTYGNVLATAQQWLLNIFKKDLFKSIQVNSRIAHSQILRTPQKHIKREKPMFLLSPRIEYGEELPMSHTLLTEKRGGIHTTGTPGVVDLKPFFYDPNSQVSLNYTEVQRCMLIDVMLTFDTSIEQMNYMDFLLLELDWNRPFDINTFLESYLANELMEMLAKISGIPIHNPNDNTVTDFLNYMNGHSYFPVTYKLSGSRGREEFYRYYPTKILATLQNLDKNTGENVNHIMTNYGITFTLRLEFWSPGLLYLMSDKVEEVTTVVPSDSTLIPIFADMFVLEDLNLAPGWEVYGHASYILDKVHDTVSYETLIQSRIQEIIKYHIKNGIPMVNFLDIKVRRMGDLIAEGADYIVDYVSNQITFNNIDWGFDTYTIIVIINTLYVNELIKELYNLE